MAISNTKLCQTPVFIKVSYVEYLFIEILHFIHKSYFIYKENTIKMFVKLFKNSNLLLDCSKTSISLILNSYIIILIMMFPIEKNTTEKSAILSDVKKALLVLIGWTKSGSPLHWIYSYMVKCPNSSCIISGIVRFYNLVNSGFYLYLFLSSFSWWSYKLYFLFSNFSTNSA